MYVVLQWCSVHNLHNVSTVIANHNSLQQPVDRLIKHTCAQQWPLQLPTVAYQQTTASFLIATRVTGPSRMVYEMCICVSKFHLRYIYLPLPQLDTPGDYNSLPFSNCSYTQISESSLTLPSQKLSRLTPIKIIINFSTATNSSTEESIPEKNKSRICVLASKSPSK